MNKTFLFYAFILGVSFTSDFKRLITVSGDGCIFIWRLSPELTRTMIDRYAKVMASKAQQGLISTADER